MTDQPLVEGTCEWEQEEPDYGSYRASCDPVRLFEFNEDGPVANHFAFCPYCGRPLVEVRPEPDAEDGDDNE